MNICNDNTLQVKNIVFLNSFSFNNIEQKGKAPMDAGAEHTICTKGEWVVWLGLEVIYSVTAFSVYIFFMGR